VGRAGWFGLLVAVVAALAVAVELVLTHGRAGRTAW
jgi:hypothetical protein